MNKDFLIKRAKIIKCIRAFFDSQEFIESETPTLVLSPGLEPHIRPLKIEGTTSFLHTSPEFAIKKLLSLGFGKIFQIGKCYRFEPKSQTHNPEFTMIEWYRTESDYLAIMNDVENLFSFLSKNLDFAPKSSNQFERIKIKDCFTRFANTDLTKMLPALNASPLEKEKFNDEFFRIFLNTIEPAIEKLGHPVIVYDYPFTQAALANTYTDSDGLVWAKRFEVYAGGFELGNAFDELTDSSIQLKRFQDDVQVRKSLYPHWPVSPIDQEFIASLNKIPPSGGIAMGVDRIVMYFTGAKFINDVLWNPSHWDY